MAAKVDTVIREITLFAYFEAISLYPFMLMNRLTGLVRRTREDRGRRRLPVEAVELIEGLFLKKPRPSAAAVYRRVLTLCKEREWASPSYSTVYAIISRLDPGLITLAHEGPARFRDKFERTSRAAGD